MIYAIPANQNDIATHFSKAAQFLIVDDKKNTSVLMTNPAVQQEGCKGKKELVNMLIAQGVESVVIRNIGERLLNKLFTHNLFVYQAVRVSQLLSTHPMQLERVLDTSKAKVSINHQKKGGCSGCCKSEVLSIATSPSISKLSPSMTSKLRRVFTIRNQKG